MEKECRVLIADSSEIIRQVLTEYLEDKFSVRTCGDGRAALELLHQFNPHILVLELMLPGIDGLSLLQAAVDADIRPAILATTRQNNDYLLDAAYRLGVSYMMLRPFPTHTMVERIEDLAISLQKYTTDPVAHLGRILCRLGFSPKAKSYPLLVDAIVQLSQNPSAFLSKELYPSVGKLHNASGTAAEKAIRDLMHSTWAKRNDSIWQLHFPPDANGNSIRPSNGVFLARMAQCLPTPLERWEDSMENKCK